MKGQLDGRAVKADVMFIYTDIEPPHLRRKDKTMVEFELTYNLNGGLGDEIVAENIEEGGAVTLPGGEGITKDGFTFGGWSETIGGEAVGDGYVMPGAATVLYAVWVEEVPEPVPEPVVPMTYAEFITECDRIIGVCIDLRSAVDYEKGAEAYIVQRITASEKIAGVRGNKVVKLTYLGFNY